MPVPQHRNFSIVKIYAVGQGCSGVEQRESGEGNDPNWIELADD